MQGQVDDLLQLEPNLGATPYLVTACSSVLPGYTAQHGLCRVRLSWALASAQLHPGAAGSIRSPQSLPGSLLDDIAGARPWGFSGYSALPGLAEVGLRIRQVEA